MQAPGPPARTASADELAAMRRALELGAAGVGSTSPNPSVGCVLVGDAGRMVGEGRTEPAGGAHAEVVALRAAGNLARGCTAVVTLEPCAHTGRTGPCTAALTAAGVRRVLFAVPDPDPAAAGGAAVLRAAGVDVVGDVLREEGERVAEAWLAAVRLGRPHVTWKFAATLDGRVAANDGSSRWVTGERARADVHRLRARSDAVVVGVGTVLADDPALTVRDSSGCATGRQPLRVVLDSGARTPASARVFGSQAPTLLAVGPGADPAAVEALRRTAAEVVVVPGTGPAGQGLDLQAVLALLHGRGVRSVLVEGGPVLAGSFHDQGLVDRVVAYLAPALLGGTGRAALAGAGAATIEDMTRLVLDDVGRLGPDLRLSGRLAGRVMVRGPAGDTAGQGEGR